MEPITSSDQVEVDLEEVVRLAAVHPTSQRVAVTWGDLQTVPEAC